MEKLPVGLIDFELRSTGGKTLMRQLYDRLRGAILAGSMPPGFRLPPGSKVPAMAARARLWKPPAPPFAVSGSIAVGLRSRAA